MTRSSRLDLKSYLPELDGLRAVAVLAVLIYHMDIFPFVQGGFSGVDIFFVISGYVISRSLYNKAEHSIHHFIGTFYKRRVLRIIPALFFFLLITHLLSILFIPFSWKNELLHLSGKAAFFGYSNFVLVFQNDGYFSPMADYNPFLHTWSLAVEEQFYLIFPLLFFLWLKFKKKKGIPVVLSWSLLPAIFLLSLFISFRISGSAHDKAYYLLHSRFWELAAGAILFQVQANLRRIKLTQGIVRVIFYSGLLLLLAGILWSDSGHFPFPWAILPVLGTAMVIFAATSFDHLQALALLNNPFMIYVGRISYSLYLWHWPVIVLLRWTIGYDKVLIKILSLVLMAIITMFSYHFIEVPIRQKKSFRQLQNWKVIIAGLGLLFLGTMLSQWMFNSREKLSLSNTKDRYTWNSGRYYQDKLREPVFDNPELHDRKLFALGDSHTAAYRTMLNILSSRLGIEIYEFEKGGCSVANLLEPMETDNWDHYHKSMNEIKGFAKKGDIVFLASLRMPELSNRFELVDTSKVLEAYFSQDAMAMRASALDDADHIIGELEQLGVTVLIDAPKPVLLIPPYRCSDWFNKNNPIAEPGDKISAALLHRIRKPILMSLDTLKERYPGLQVWDPFPALCEGDMFSAYDQDGLPYYYDGDHLSGHGNRILEPSFEAKILEIWKIE